jgi:prohibitin 2
MTPLDRGDRRRFARGGVLGGIAFVCLVAVLTHWPWRSVSAGHRGVVTLFGEVRPGSLLPGLNFVNPLAQVHEVSVQVQKSTMKGDAASKDLQHVQTTLAVNYNLMPDSVDRLYSNIGMEYEERILHGTGQDTFKAVTSRYTAEELIGKREDVRQTMLNELRAKVAHLSGNTIAVDDVFITNFDFSPEFNKAIEAKQEAEQLALKAQRDLGRIKTEAEQKIATAQAEAAALRAQKQEITPELIRLRETENQREAIRKWNGALPTYAGGGAPIPFIGIK